METDCKYLFVYGSLMNYDNEFAIYLNNNSRSYTKGNFNGLLYDMGEYPGAIFNKNTTYLVYGCI